MQLGENKSTLYQSETVQGHSKEEIQRRLQIAQSKFQMAERKFRMASVLVGGGFALEAEVPAREALEMAWKSMAIVPVIPSEELVQLRDALQLLSVEDEPTALSLTEGVQTILNAVADNLQFKNM